MQRFPREFGRGSKNLQQIFYTFFLRSISGRLWVENEKNPSNKHLVFNQSVWLLSSLTAVLLVRQESQMTIGFSIPSTLMEGSKRFWNHPNCGHPRVLKLKPFDFDSPFPRNIMRHQQIVISIKSCTCSVISLTISMQYNFWFFNMLFEPLKNNSIWNYTLVVFVKKKAPAPTLTAFMRRAALQSGVEAIALLLVDARRIKWVR